MGRGKPKFKRHRRRDYTNVMVSNNTITVCYCNHQNVIFDLLNAVNSLLNNGISTIYLRFDDNIGQFFPQVLVPIVGIIEQLRSDGIKVSVDHNPRLNDFNLDSIKYFDASSPIDSIGKIWKFDKDNSHALVDRISQDLEKKEQFPKGVITLAEWSLNEVIDNVLNHSEAPEGFLMVQLHPTTKHIAYCVYDNGIGIQKSFLNGGLKTPSNQVEAIQLAVSEGITSNTDKGQGNGLFGLHSLVEHGDGRLSIVSGNGNYKFEGKKITTKDGLPSYRNRNSHTTVDFTVNYSSKIALEDVLTFQGNHYKPISLRFENLEDDMGHVNIKMNELSSGVGTREAAKEQFNTIMNILTEEVKVITLDFKDVTIISSSYADELIAKLMLKLGLFQFNNIIRLQNMNEDVQLVLQRSVMQRMVSTYTSQQ